MLLPNISLNSGLKQRKENNMKDKKKNGWIKFVPSLDLPKDRVSIAYDTHDERGVRYAYGYFQFYNGTCGCFWKDGNEQPKVVKAEDIKYWMPVPSLDMQEEPAEWSEEDENHAKSILSTIECCKAQFPNAQAVVEAYNADIEWFKNLKERCNWKPSDEQIKVCKEVYADILSAKGFKLDTINRELNRLEADLKKLRRNKL